MSCCGIEITYKNAVLQVLEKKKSANIAEIIEEIQNNLKDYPELHAFLSHVSNYDLKFRIARMARAAIFKMVDHWEINFCLPKVLPKDDDTDVKSATD